MTFYGSVLLYRIDPLNENALDVIPELKNWDRLPPAVK